MKNFSLLFLFILAIAFNSCKNKNAEPETVTVDRNAPEMKEHQVANAQVQFNDPKVEAVFYQYLQLESALINTDSAKAASEASKLQLIIKEVDDDAATDRALSEIANTDDIEVQRHNFVALTTAMEDILDGALTSGTVYKQYCPMAFNNTGAYWLSNTKEIFNPYFGKKMMKCGRVDAEIQ